MSSGSFTQHLVVFDELETMQHDDLQDNKDISIKFTVQPMR